MIGLSYFCRTVGERVIFLYAKQSPFCHPFDVLRGNVKMKFIIGLILAAPVTVPLFLMEFSYVSFCSFFSLADR